MKKYLFLFNFLFAASIAVNAQSLSASFQAGLGTDVTTMTRISPIQNFKFPIHAADDGSFEVTEPVFYGLLLNYHFNESWQLQTGFSLLDRRIKAPSIYRQEETVIVFTTETMVPDTKIDFNTYGIPLYLQATLNPNQDKKQWTIGLKAGLIYEWTGYPAPTYRAGPASVEKKGSYAIIEPDTGVYRLFIRRDTDGGGGILTTSFGLSFDKTLKDNSQIGVDIFFNHQLYTPTKLLVWGYSKALDTRISGYNVYEFQFNTLVFAMHYSLPWRINFGKKKEATF